MKTSTSLAGDVALSRRIKLDYVTQIQATFLEVSKDAILANLIGLVYLLEDRENEYSSNIFLNLGGSMSLTRLMKNWIHCPEIQEKFCSLAGLLAIDSVAQKKAVVQDGLLAALATSIQKHPGNEDLHENALNAISSFCKVKSIAAMFVNSLNGINVLLQRLCVRVCTLYKRENIRKSSTTVIVCCDLSSSSHKESLENYFRCKLRRSQCKLLRPFVSGENKTQSSQF